MVGQEIDQIDQLKAHYIMFLGGNKDGEKWMAPSVPYRRVDLRFPVMVPVRQNRQFLPLDPYEKVEIREERYVNTGRVREGCVVYEIQE